MRKLNLKTIFRIQLAWECHPQFLFCNTMGKQKICNPLWINPLHVTLVVNLSIASTVKYLSNIKVAISKDFSFHISIRLCLNKITVISDK
jgi:hypothetical protein